MHAVSSLAEPDYAVPVPLDENTWILLRARSHEIVFICMPYIPSRQSLPPSLPHPYQSVAVLKDSQPNLAGERVGAYLLTG